MAARDKRRVSRGRGWGFHGCFARVSQRVGDEGVADALAWPRETGDEGGMSWVSG